MKKIRVTKKQGTSSKEVLRCSSCHTVIGVGTAQTLGMKCKRCFGIIHSIDDFDIINQADEIQLPEKRDITGWEEF